jgi:hypothetical protein
MNQLSQLEQQFARLCRIAFTVWKQMDAEVPADKCEDPPPPADYIAKPAHAAHDPIPVGIPNAPPPPDDTLSATKRVRRTKAQIAADNAAIGTAPAPAEPGTELTAEDRKALRLELSEAVRASLAVNGEAETVRRLGYPKISAVPDNALAAIIKAMKG